jgi:WD40 repeat protein
VFPLRLLRTIISTFSRRSINAAAILFARVGIWWHAVLARRDSASHSSLRLWSRVAAAGGPSPATMRHHARGVTDVALSSDGHLLSSASCDCTVKLWNLDTNQLLATKEPDSGSPNHVWAVVFAPDGSVFAAGSTDGSIRIWEASHSSNGGEGAPMTRIPAHCPKPVKALAFSPDGALLASGSGDGEVKLWAWRDGVELKQRCFPGRGVAGVSKLAFSPDGRHLACASEEQTVSLWDVAGWALTARLAGCGGDARGLAYSGDSRWLAHADGDTKVKIAEIKVGECIPLAGRVQEMDLGQVVYDVSFSHDGRLLAVALGCGVVEILERENSKPVGTLRGFSGAATAVAFSRDSRLLVSGSWDSSVKLWRAESKFGLRDYWAAFTGGLRRA